MSDQMLREALEAARQQIAEQRELIQQLTATPLMHAVVLFSKVPYEIDDEEMLADLVAVEGGVVAVEHTKVTTPGDGVLIQRESLQIVGVVDPIASGDVCTVKDLDGGGVVEITLRGEPRSVLAGKFTDLEKGTRVVLDDSGRIVLADLGKEEGSYRSTTQTNVTWDDIGGQVDAKREMVEAVEMPFTHSELYAFYGKKPVKGVLLYGPPGCGKTMLGKATSTSLARLHGSDGGAGFFYVKGPEILNPYIGVTEETIRTLFENARAHKAEHGYPAVIFFDEADAVFGKRGMGISSDIERTLVPMFLAEMDGLEESAALLILATNRADVLDPAVVRDGRIDRKIKVSRPTESEAEEIFGLHLRGVPTDGAAPDELAQIGAQALYAEEHGLYEIRLKGGESRILGLSSLSSGALIAGIVDQATSLAVHRDIGGRKRLKHSGLMRDDLAQAVHSVVAQNRDLNHEDVIEDYLESEGFNGNVAGIHRMKGETHAAA
jgi:proteasome-associated ATPase